MEIEESMKIVTLIPAYKCNSRCGHCGLWKTKEDGLSMEAIGKLFSSKYMQLQNVYVTGGEPFLFDVSKMAETIIKNNPKLSTLVFATNGYLTDKIYNDIVYMKLLGITPKIAISLDGRKEMHDRVRGVTGAYDKVMETVNKLKGVCDISFVFLMMPKNIKEIPYYLEIANELGISAEFCLARKSERFGNDYDSSYERSKIRYTDKQKEELLLELNKSPKVGSVDRIYQFAKRYFYDKQKIHCLMGYDQVIVCPNGDIRACIDDRPFNIMGNINTQTFDEIVESKRRQEVLEHIGQNKCQPCPNPCDGPKYLIKD